jgi:hypothetical protein
MIIYFLVSIISIYYIIKIIYFKNCYHFATDIAAVSLANLIN